MRKIFSASLTIILFLCSSSAYTQDAKLIAKHKNWLAYSYTQNKQKTCYIASKPILEEGKYKVRGPVWLLVNHTPARKEVGVLSFMAGYTYRPKCNNSNREDCQVITKVGKNKFKMYTDKDIAWNYPGGDEKMIKQMIRGSTLTIEGKSHRGTNTKDTFSLLGFTAAYREISKACNVTKRN